MVQLQLAVSGTENIQKKSGFSRVSAHTFATACMCKCMLYEFDLRIIKK